jgi:lysozyme
MTYSKDGLHLTESFEGIRLTAYPDPGTGGEPWTIGYGHTGNDVCGSTTCTQEQAEAWLLQDVQKAAAAVNDLVQVDLTQNEFDALVDFVFNLGVGNFKSSTLLRKINAGDMDGAAAEFDKWDRAAGKVMAGLLRRRQAETDLFNQEDV